jgi:cytochrome P450
MIDFKSPQFVLNPYPFYKQLRQADGPQWLPHKQLSSKSPGLWLFGRYEDVAAIFKLSGTLFSNQTNRVRAIESVTPMDHTLLTLDPPEHTRLRNLARQAFNAKRIKGLESRIEKIAMDRILAMKNSGKVDFISSFAMPFPVAVLADLLGVPAEDWNIFNHWSIQIIKGYDSILADETDLQQQEQALHELVVTLVV